jgi:hypothetical protein
MNLCSRGFQKGWLSAKNILLTKPIPVYAFYFILEQNSITVNHHSVLVVTVIFSASESALVLVLVVLVVELMQTVTI